MTRMVDCGAGHRIKVTSRRCLACWRTLQRARAPGQLSLSEASAAADRLAAHSEIRDGCVVWTGCISNGYGVIHFLNRRWSTHRLAYTAARGPIPSGLFVCHTCDNPPCINPQHLFLGTHGDNLRDASAKGRMHPGERHGSARLRNADIAVIRGRLGAGDRGVDIAADYGVNPNTIYHVKKGRTWARS